MKPLLSLARAIDRLNTGVGRLVYWLVLVVTLVSAGNALMRYTFDISSNAWLELQWYLFSAIFLFAAPYTLLKNEMVRIDVVHSRLSPRVQQWIEIVGIVLFLLPMSVLLMYLSWPVFVQAYTRGEMSSNAGGLIVWPGRLMVPVGFFLLTLQGISQLIKQIAFMRGEGPDPNHKEGGKSAEQELAEEIARQRGVDVPLGDAPAAGHGSRP
jgi:TRAP-type mannitol/chloroaromatic compound transport system permease small subunit